MALNSIDFRTSWTPREASGDVIFSALQASHQKALDARPSEALTTDFILAGATVRMRIVGRHLAALICGPFRHLSALGDAGNPHLTIDLWDKRVTRIECPQGVRELEEEARTAGEADLVITVGTAQDRHVGHLRRGISVWIDREAAHAIGWVESSAQLSIQDRGKPLHFPLLLWHADRGAPVIHAALVSYHGQGALLVGKGGGGKTTAALACLLGGLDFLADDYVGLERAEGGTFFGHSLYDSAWLTADGEARFPSLVPYAAPRERSGTAVKRLVPMFDAAPDRLGISTQVHAVVATILSDDPSSSIRPISRAAAHLALAPSSMLQLPISGRSLLERISQLIECVPTYQLNVGGDLASLSLIVRELLEPRGQR